MTGVQRAERVGRQLGMKTRPHHPSQVPGEAVREHGYSTVDRKEKEKSDYGMKFCV